MVFGAGGTDPGPISSAAEEEFSAPQPAGQKYTGTMNFGAGSEFTGEAPVVATTTARRTGPTVSMSPNVASEQTARLEYVCQLLKKSRQPYCPINGVMTLIPFDLIKRGEAESVEVQRAVRNDLETILRTTQLRTQVISLVVGMEAESGFRELVRRIGKEPAKAQRFGKGFNVWNPPIPEQIEAVSTHACGAFEDWAYALFREKDGLSKTGNTKLYSLMCKIRSQLRTRLEGILVDAYSREADNGSSGKGGLLFSGCYFAATGETEDRQAFVKSVFDRMFEQEAELDWTDEAVAEDARYQRMANLAIGFSGLLILAMIGMVLHKSNIFQKFL
jgi:hypothetical protein